MSLRRFISLLFLVLLCKFAYAQLEVKKGSFKEVPGFVNINRNKMNDDNDKPYAVLKIKTENIDGKQRRELNFGGDAQTFFEVEYKDGEVWLYISYYASYIKISHDDFSSVDFYFPLDMQPQKGYEMTLVNRVKSAPVVSTNKNYNLTFIVNGVSFEMVAVKGDIFTMGCTGVRGGEFDDDARPIHSVTLSDYYIGKCEVTQKLWKAVMGYNPSNFKGDDLPVENVSWYDCKEFIGRLNRLTGANFRLPTEAEWEYAARGGSETSLYNGENIRINGKNNSPNLDVLAWYGGNCGQNYTSGNGCDVTNGYDISGWSEKQYNDNRGGTHPVGQKQPNAYGLYDMLGNVYEWCEDLYGGYSGDSQTNPMGPHYGSCRVLRGGSWSHYASDCRVSYRSSSYPDRRGSCQGFRLALVQ